MTKIYWGFLLAILMVSSCVNADNNQKNNDANSTKQIIIQSLLNQSKLNFYFHTDVFPNRIPLVLVKNKIFQGAYKLRKFGKPVKLIEVEEISKQGLPHMDIYHLEVSGNSVIVKFKYPDEGVVGVSKLIFSGGAWKIQEEEIIER